MYVNISNLSTYQGVAGKIDVKFDISLIILNLEQVQPGSSDVGRSTDISLLCHEDEKTFVSYKFMLSPIKKKDDGSGFMWIAMDTFSGADIKIEAEMKWCEKHFLPVLWLFQP